MANYAKLTPDQISEMRRLFAEGASQKSLAERYGVSISTVVNRLKNDLGIKNDLGKPKEECECSDLDPRPPDVAEEEGPEHFVDCEVKPPKPKRRIVGVNI